MSLRFFFTSFYYGLSIKHWPNRARIHTHTQAIIGIIQHHKRRTITRHHQIHSENNLKKANTANTHKHTPSNTTNASEQAKKSNARQADRHGAIYIYK